MLILLRTIRKWLTLLCVTALVATLFAVVEAAPAQAAAARPAGSFVVLAPSRVLDTRSANGAAGPIHPGRSVSFPILGRGGVPSSGVSAVTLTLTATSATGSGFATVFADGTAAPGTSVVNFVKGRSAANMVTVQVGANGRIRVLTNGAGTVQMVADVSGYYVAGTPTAAGTYRPVAPTRLLDTRSGLGGAVGPVAGNGTRTVAVAGVGGVPKTGVSAVVLNVTVTSPGGTGSITVYPSQAPRPVTANLNFSIHQTVANTAVVPLWSAGRLTLVNSSPASAHLIVDVVGYYVNGYSGLVGTLQTVAQQRVLDTRKQAAVPAGGTYTLRLAGVASIPAAGTSAATVNVTVVTPRASGYLTVFAAGTARPATSNVDFVAGSNVTDLVTVRMGAGGQIKLYNGSGGTVQLLVDIVGVFWDGSGAARCNAVTTDPAGTSVTRWNPLVACILSVLGQSSAAGNVNDVDLIIRYESSGDPNAVNRYDINWQEGHPSEGLIQVIRPTFDEWRSPLLADDLLNPAANLFAGLNYAIHRYGSIHNVPGLVSLRQGGPYKGYIQTS